jgi:hypothetical protein
MRYVCSNQHACDDFYQHQAAKIRYVCHIDREHKEGYSMMSYCNIMRTIVSFKLESNFKEEINKILEI